MAATQNIQQSLFLLQPSNPVYLAGIGGNASDWVLEERIISSPNAFSDRQVVGL